MCFVTATIVLTAGIIFGGGLTFLFAAAALIVTGVLAHLLGGTARLMGP